MMHPERFDAPNVLWSHADDLSRLYFRMKAANDVGTAYAGTPTDTLLIGNFAGMLNEARDKVADSVPSILPPYGLSTTSDVAGRDCSLYPGPGVALLITGPARLAARTVDGVKVWVSYSKTPGEYVEGSASASNGTANVDAPAGQWYANMKLDPAMTWSGTANLFAGSV